MEGSELHILIGKQLSYYRYMCGMEQADVAKNAHISIKRLKRIEKGETDYPIMLLVVLCNLLNKDWHMVLTTAEMVRCGYLSFEG
jgi:DNA-binding XRE family transcriptional regulator